MKGAYQPKKTKKLLLALLENAGKVLKMQERICKVVGKVLKLWERFGYREKVGKVLTFQERF